MQHDNPTLLTRSPRPRVRCCARAVRLPPTRPPPGLRLSDN
jgi:hypothetical protein